MNTSYIYSASRVATLSQELLSKTDIDRLLVAAPGQRLASALKETYLAPYLLQNKNEDMAEAIELTLIEAKNIISSIAPDSAQFSVLWVQYDIHNLRVLAKATVLGLPVEQLSEYFSERGAYQPATLAEYARDGALSNLYVGWQEAYTKAVELVAAGALDQVDSVFDVLVLSTMSAIAETAKDPFISVYTKAVIDMHNIKSSLRALKLADKIARPVHVSGGAISADRLRDIGEIHSVLEYLAPGHFTSALEQYQQDGHTTVLDARYDEYLIKLAHEASIDMFSAASIVAYYLHVRQSATNVRTIVVGLESGQSADVIRPNVRMSYVTN